MPNKTLFTLAFQYLSHRKLRSWLTIIGVVIGISLVATIILLSSGLANAVLGFLRSFGPDIVIVLPGKEGSPSAVFLGARLRDKDAAAIREVEGVEVVVPASILASEEVTFHGKTEKTSLIGQPVKEARAVLESSQGIKVASGDWPDSETAKEVLVGSRFAKYTFGEDILAGDTLILKGRAFTVKGILEEIGDRDIDTSVFLSLEQLRRLIGIRDNIFRMLVKVAPGYDPKDLAERIREKLETVPGISDFSVLTSEKAQEVIGNVIGILQLVLTGIAIFTLVVGGVGIMNTMYTSVLERTRHIGILKAVGASSRQIATLFVIESGLIGLVGGLIGTTIGISLAKLVEFIAHQAGFALLAVKIQPLWIIGVFLFAFLVGIISGFLPARQAASLRPAEALRYE